TTVAACSDFSRFANGAWLAHDTIPAAYSSSGVTRDMSDRNELVVRSVLEDAAARRNSFPPASTPRKLGTFYATCMDSTAIDAAGLRGACRHHAASRAARLGHSRPASGRRNGARDIARAGLAHARGAA